jgi:hypothetical protein
MDLTELGYNGVHWIQLSQDTVQTEAFYDHKDDPYDYIQTGHSLNALISMRLLGKTT